MYKSECCFNDEKYIRKIIHVSRIFLSVKCLGMKWQRNLQHLGTTVSEQRDVVRNKERKENLKISIPKDNKETNS